MNVSNIVIYLYYIHDLLQHSYPEISKDLIRYLTESKEKFVNLNHLNEVIGETENEIIEGLEEAIDFLHIELMIEIDQNPEKGKRLYKVAEEIANHIFFDTSLSEETKQELKKEQEKLEKEIEALEKQINDSKENPEIREKLSKELRLKLLTKYQGRKGEIK